MACTFGTASTRTSSAGNPITTASFTITRDDHVVVLALKAGGGTNRAGGSPTFGGVTMTQAGTTQKAATSPESSCEIWYLVNPCKAVGAPGSYTLTIPNTGALTIFYVIATGRAPSGGSLAFEKALTNNGTSANPSAGTSGSEQPSANIVFGVCCDGATTWSPSAQTGTGYGGTGTSLGNFDDGSEGAGHQYWLNVGSGGVNFGWTFATSEDWGTVVAFFREIAPQQFENYMGIRSNSGMGVTEKIR